MKKSIYEKVSFKQVMFFCLFLIAMNLWRVFNFISNKEAHIMPWLSISAGLLLVAMAIFVRYRTEEKIAFLALGMSLIMTWLSNIKFISVPLSSLFSIVFIIGALYFYHVSYRTSENIAKIKPISLFLLLILILILIVPPLFFWIIGILSNITN
ncbi:MAG: hypothetical protein JSV30_03345 [Candidatus Omnitrophota bacterium]|nr:MAG: hypothetical protein JSV30_03345 [Candidatus Omnitrophota bacterium]